MKKMAFLLSFLLLVIPCTAATITVDWDGSADYTTIQAGIDAAVSGADTVVVAEGTYVENISFGGKNIILTSENPEEPNIVADTIIDGGGVDTVVRFNGTETSDCKLLGFTITNGYGPADGDGGGIDGNLLGPDTQATVANCIIRDNVAQKHGGGIRNVNGSIDRCIITGNSTVNRNGGGLVGCHGTISNCLIYNNAATLSDGGMVNCNGDIVNCTIVENTAGDGTGGIAACTGTITNCIIWDNVGTVGDQVTDSSTPTYSCIQDWSGGGTGNISTDPKFADPCDADYHLLPGSFCIDAGTNSPPLGLPTTDLDGQFRPLDGDNDGQMIADMGCYESLPGADPVIGLSALDFEFLAIENDLNPSEQILTIRNTGGGTLHWLIDCNSPWLEVEPTAGTSTSEPNEVTLSFDTSGLSIGVYDCNMIISDPCAVNSPSTVNVLLHILDSDSVKAITLDYDAESYAYAYALAFAVTWYDFDIDTDHDFSSNIKCQSSVWADAYKDEWACPMENYLHVWQDSRMQVSSEGLDDLNGASVTSKLKGWGFWEYWNECGSNGDSGDGVHGPSEGYGNGYTLLTGTIEIGIFEGYPYGSTGLTLKLNAEITGDSPASWDTWDWWLKVWDDDPCNPLLELDDLNMSTDLPVLAGQTLNIEFYHEADKDPYWPDFGWPEAGLDSTVTVDLNVCVPGTADIDGSGYIDIGDLVVVALQWLDTPGTLSADIAPEPLDNFVDYQDFAVVKQRWQTCTE